MQALNQCGYLRQFLTEICGCLPPSLKINGTIYAEADHYIAQAKADPRFKHDLLIGADMEGAHIYMPIINSEASATPEQTPFALVRKAEDTGLPSACEVNPFGELTNCYAPTRPSWELPVTAGVIGFIALIALAAVISQPNSALQSRRRF